MHEQLRRYISVKKWLIKQDGWEPKRQSLNEAIFTIGNGYIGSRGVLEEIPYDSYAGTYISGIYDSTGSQTTELVNMPNPINFKIIIGGEKLGVIGMDIISHKRILDMRTGTLYRRTIFQDSKKRKYDYSSARFFCMDNKHIGAMKILFTPLDADANVTIETITDTAVTNRGVLTEGRKKHTETVELSTVDNIRYRCVQTYENKIQASYGTFLLARIGKDKVYIPERAHELKIRKNSTVCFEKYMAIYTTFDIGSSFLKKTTVEAVQDAVYEGFDGLYNKNKAARLKRWKTANINIKGDAESDMALRFNIYHLLITAPERDGRSSIGARALSAEGYRGHVFWDTEIFMFPFFAYTNPPVARNILMYRYNRLNAARGIAEERGYKGAMFPWESADTGKEATPTWYKDLDGSIIRIKTMEMQQHITCDVAYAVSHYYNTTEDNDFMLKFGLEVMYETARFWASRAEYNKKTKTYDINNVIGPDEFHEAVTNNAYTNIMAKWNILRAIQLHRRFVYSYRKGVSQILEKINLSKEEIRHWASVGSAITPPSVNKEGVIEQFKGYFRKKKIRISSLDSNFMPYYPHKISLKKMKSTQFVKQADVVMLLYLLGDHFSKKAKTVNYRYYNSRTLHKSSLSPSIHSIAALDAGDYTRAFQYFTVAVNADLRNIHGDPQSGIHAASLGGTWQAVVNGFAGIRLKRKILSIEPRLPYKWKGIETNLFWKGRLLNIKEEPAKVSVFIKSEKTKDALDIRIFGSLKRIPVNKKFIFHAQKPGKGKVR